MTTLTKLILLDSLLQEIIIMGNWQLEVGKMAIYMAFPVVTFYAYHQVDWFADQYKMVQRKVHSSEDPKAREELKEFIKALQEQKEKKKNIEMAKMWNTESDDNK
jgi:protein PET100